MSALDKDHPHNLRVKNTGASQGLPQPVVVSVSQHGQVGDDNCNGLELIEKIGLILEELAAVVRDNGGFIGHIKALVSTPAGASVGLSVVRDRVQTQGLGLNPNSPTLPLEEPIAEFTIALTAIVYGYSKNELHRLVQLGLDKCCNSRE